MPPVPVGPGSMQSHQRRESTQSAHTESGPSHLHGPRSGMQNSGRRGGHQAYGQNNHHYQQQTQYSNGGYGRGGYANPNQNRGPPPNMNQQAYGPGPVQGYNTNPPPRNMHRSPAMSHASPSLAAVQPMVTPQLYPPQQYMSPPQQVSDLFFLSNPNSLSILAALPAIYTLELIV